MAQAFDVNLTITSYLGYRSAADSIIGPVPIVQTLHTLNGEDIAPISNPFAAVIKVEPIDTFIFQPRTTSTAKIVYVNNNGFNALTVTNITFSTFGVNPSISSTNVLPLTIQPGTSSSFLLSYYAEDLGYYNNNMIIYSNNYSGPYRVLTAQNVGYAVGFIIDPNGYTSTVLRIGQYLRNTYNLISTSTDPNDINVTPTRTVMKGSPAWTITGTGTNIVSVKFNPNEVNNVNGTYVSTLTVYSGETFYSVTNTATININHDENKSLSNWLSPASHYNSIVGLSYDLYNNQRVLTIGVGIGADSSSIYDISRSTYANANNLGLGAEINDLTYPFWAKVYRIPFTGGVKTYYSSDYVVKTTEGLDYSSYFGEYRAPGSMFIIEDDGYGSIKIEINHLRDFILDIDASLATTLKNLTRAFYYYSNVDILGRYSPLPAEYVAPISSNVLTTNLFIGFNYNTRDKIAYVATSVVDLPI
jgi:hypothetical protein